MMLTLEQYSYKANAFKKIQRTFNKQSQNYMSLNNNNKIMIFKNAQSFETIKISFKLQLD